MRGPFVEIACKVVQERELSIVITDGTMEPFTDNQGNETQREKWHFIPRSQVQEIGPTSVTMTEWIATQKGLT